jgi:tetratricopeptide (TPR) repeat protein
MQAQELIKRFDFALEKSRAGDHISALQEFESLERLSTHPQDIAALRFFQATCLTDLGKAEEALTRISSVDKNKLAFANQVDYEYEYARIERALGHTRQAFDRVKTALKMIAQAADLQDVNIVSRNLHTMCGILLAESGKCDEAAPLLEAVPAEDEGWAEARLLLGDCSYKNRRYREAIDYYLSLMASANETPSIIGNDAVRNIGCAYHQLGDYAKAVEYLSKIKDAYNEYPNLKADLYGFLASAYSHLGMTQEAAKYSGFSKGTNSIQ